MTEGRFSTGERFWIVDDWKKAQDPHVLLRGSWTGTTSFVEQGTIGPAIRSLTRLIDGPGLRDPTLRTHLDSVYLDCRNPISCIDPITPITTTNTTRTTRKVGKENKRRKNINKKKEQAAPRGIDDREDLVDDSSDAGRKKRPSAIALHDALPGSGSASGGALLPVLEVWPQAAGDEGALRRREGPGYRLDECACWKSAPVNPEPKRGRR